MRVDIEDGKYTYIFEDGCARLLRYGEPTSRDVVGDKLIYCMAAEIDELRQQVTLLRDELNTVYKLVPDLVPVMHPSALDTTDDLSGYILCEKAPVAWEYFHSRAEPPLSVDFDDPDCIKAFPSDVVWKIPLYRAKEQGK